MSKPKFRIASRPAPGVLTLTPAQKTALYSKEMASFDTVAKRVPGVKSDVCAKSELCVCSACENGRRMNREALAFLANARAVAAAPAVPVRVLPDGTRWVENIPGDLKIPQREKHQANLLAAIERKRVREAAEKEAMLKSKARLLKPGQRRDVQQVVANSGGKSSGVDTSQVGSNKCFGTQGRWD